MDLLSRLTLPNLGSRSDRRVHRNLKLLEPETISRRNRSSKTPVNLSLVALHRLQLPLQVVTILKAFSSQSFLKYGKTWAKTTSARWPEPSRMSASTENKFKLNMPTCKRTSCNSYTALTTSKRSYKTLLKTSTISLMSTPISERMTKPRTSSTRELMSSPMSSGKLSKTAKKATSKRERRSWRAALLNSPRISLLCAPNNWCRANLINSRSLFKFYKTTTTQLRRSSSPKLQLPTSLSLPSPKLKNLLQLSRSLKVPMPLTSMPIVSLDLTSFWLWHSNSKLSLMSHNYRPQLIPKSPVVRKTPRKLLPLLPKMQPSPKKASTSKKWRKQLRLRSLFSDSD